MVDDVLHNYNNKLLVGGIIAAGGAGASISGKKLLRAKKLYSKDAETGEPIDIGFVGEIIAADVRAVKDALNFRAIPVITPLAQDFHGQVYNINADTAACELAKALNARKLVFLSDVPGILKDPKDESSLISTIHTQEVPGLIEEALPCVWRRRYEQLCARIVGSKLLERNVALRLQVGMAGVPYSDHPARSDSRRKNPCRCHRFRHLR